MTGEHYQRIAYIGVLNDDGSLKIGIPLYVKVNGDMSAEQRKHLYEISAEIVRRYEKQISAYFQKLKKEQAKNDDNKV